MMLGMFIDLLGGISSTLFSPCLLLPGSGQG
jgi:hypothetical protein